MLVQGLKRQGLKRKVAPLLAAVFLCVAGGALYAAAPAYKVLSMGRAAATGHEANDRQAAMTDAQAQAVAQAALALSAQTAVRSQMDSLLKEIIAKAPQFVSTYNVQSVGRSESEVWVLLEVVLDRSALEQALSQQGLARDMPRLSSGQEAGALPPPPPTLLLVSEETGPGRPAAYWWSGQPWAAGSPVALKRIFNDLSVPLVDSKAFTPGLAPDLRQEALQEVLNESQALELGQAAGAGLVILGRMRCYPLAAGSPEAASPFLQLVALDVNQRRPLAAVEALAPAYDAMPGPEAAAQLEVLALKNVEQLLTQAGFQALAAAGASVSVINIEVAGLNRLADLMEFERALRSLDSMVAEVRRTAVGGGQADLLVTAETNARRLADELTLLNFTSFLLDIREISGQSLKINLIPLR